LKALTLTTKIIATVTVLSDVVVGGALPGLINAERNGFTQYDKAALR